MHQRPQWTPISPPLGRAGGVEILATILEFPYRQTESGGPKSPLASIAAHLGSAILAGSTFAILRGVLLRLFTRYGRSSMCSPLHYLELNIPLTWQIDSISCVSINLSNLITDVTCAGHRLRAWQTSTVMSRPKPAAMCLQWPVTTKEGSVMPC